jgi:hypothetical protein
MKCGISWGSISLIIENTAGNTEQGGGYGFRIEE